MDPSGPGPGRVRGRGRVLEVLDPSGPGPLKSWGSAMSSPGVVHTQTATPAQPWRPQGQPGCAKAIP